MEQIKNVDFSHLFNELMRLKLMMSMAGKGFFFTREKERLVDWPWDGGFMLTDSIKLFNSFEANFDDIKEYQP